MFSTPQAQFPRFFKYIPRRRTRSRSRSLFSRVAMADAVGRWSPGSSCACRFICISDMVIDDPGSLRRWTCPQPNRSVHARHPPRAQPALHEPRGIISSRVRSIYRCCARSIAACPADRRAGQTSQYSADARDRDPPFTAKDEPATLPRVDQLIVITEISPWCTIVRNPNGVTLGDVCTTIWRE